VSLLEYTTPDGVPVLKTGRPARVSINEFNRILGYKLRKDFTGELGTTGIIIKKLEY